MDPELPDDVVIHILERVPDWISLFRCSVVCKHWRRLVADPVFLRRRWPEDTTTQPSLLGFFVQRRRTNFSAQRSVSSPRPSPSRAPAFIPAPNSAVLWTRSLFLTSFIRDKAGVLDKAKPLVSRGSLILVRVAPRSSEKNTILRLCVCNLLTGSRERLPVLDASFLDDHGVRGYGLVTAADYDDAGSHQQLAHGYSSLFQVLLIGFGQDGHLYLLKFSSGVAGSRRWCTDDCLQATRAVRLRGPYGCSNAAVANGTAHWLFRGPEKNPRLYILNVSVSTGGISMTELALDVSTTTWLCSIDSKLSLLYLRHNRLFIWSLAHQDDGTSVWHGIHLPVPVRNARLSRVCAGENSGTVLKVYRSDSEYAYVHDIQSGSSTKVEGWIPSFDTTTLVPYEINWPMFFMSRLGVQI